MQPGLPPEANRMAPDRAPTPFSAALIAAACRPGREDVYLIEEGDAPPVHHATRFVGGDDRHAEVESVELADDGTPVGDPAAGRAAWTDLQAHASYPAHLTTITSETVTVPAGEFDCWRYRVVDGDAATTCWFARDLPGPPVRKVDTVDGHRVAAMTMVCHTPAP